MYINMIIIIVSVGIANDNNNNSLADEKLEMYTARDQCD